MVSNFRIFDLRTYLAGIGKTALFSTMIDKWWVKLNRVSLDYKSGQICSSKHSMSVAAVDRKIKCPCRECGNTKRLDHEEVRDHLIAVCMLPAYEVGLCFGWPIIGTANTGSSMEDVFKLHIDILPLIWDSFWFWNMCHIPRVLYIHVSAKICFAQS